MSKEIDVKIDDVIKERDFAIQSYENLTRWYNNLAYFMEKSLGYSMIEVHHIANKDFEMQDVERKYNEMGGSVHLEAVYRKNREVSLEYVEEQFHAIIVDDNLSTVGKNRKLEVLFDDMKNYFHLPDEPTKENYNEYLADKLIELYYEIKNSNVLVDDD